MSRHLFGIETELAVAASRGDGSPVPLEELLPLLFEEARRTLCHVPDERGGMFLENGARFYRDAGGNADHLEYATPETVTPWDAVRHVRAGEELMLALAAGLSQTQGGLGCIRVMKHNANYGRERGAAWGTHESYLHCCQDSRLAKALIPFLASRIVITGAGGFDPFSAGIRFLVSPRVAHLSREISADTTHERGIYNTKNENLCGEAGEWRRLHLVCGESNCSETSSWLKIATTAMVVAMADAAVPAGESVTLLRPMEAMKRFAADPALRRTARREGGTLVSPLQIQRHYLELAETCLNREFMPAWSEQACALWRDVLDGLERGGAEAEALRLDWAIKHALFSRHLARRGFSWQQAEQLTRQAVRLQRVLDRAGECDCHGNPDYLRPRHLHHPGPAMTEPLQGADAGRLARFLEVRDELFELDLRFMTLGPAGLFGQLDQAGVLAHRVTGLDDIPQAMASPPQGSRASARGRAVRELYDAGAASGSLCIWSMVSSPRGHLDLRDPFAADAAWVPFSDSEADGWADHRARMLIRLARLWS